MFINKCFVANIIHNINIILINININVYKQVFCSRYYSTERKKVTLNVIAFFKFRGRLRLCIPSEDHPL